MERVIVATVFDVFKEIPYTYLSIKKGQVYGNRIVDQKDLTGIFKSRTAESSVVQMGVKTSTATLHAHPEDFGNPDNLVGNGVRVNGTDYEIVRVTVGNNFATGEVEHLTFTLEVAKYVSE